MKIKFRESAGVWCAVLMIAACSLIALTVSAQDVATAAPDALSSPAILLPKATPLDAIAAQEAKLEKASPQIAAKSKTQRERVAKESLEECIGRLGDLMYYKDIEPSLSGPLLYRWPVDNKRADCEILEMLSNRRVAKIIVEIASSKRLDAAALVSNRIEQALAEYRALSGPLLADPLGSRSVALSGDTSKLVLPPDAGSRDNGPNGELVLEGARRELFSLAFVVGYLRMTDASEALLTLARHAQAQRDLLQIYQPDAGIPKPKDLANYTPVVTLQSPPVELLYMYSLYNRMALASGLLGCLDEAARTAFLDSGHTVEHPMGNALSVATPYDCGYDNEGEDFIGREPEELVQVKFPADVSDADIDTLIAAVANRFGK